LEEGHAQTEPVGVGELLVLADGETVVQDIVMGQQHPLGSRVVPDVYCI